MVPVALLGHKGDLGLMALGSDVWRLRQFQTEAVGGGLVPPHSYVSLTEDRVHGGVPKSSAKPGSPTAAAGGKPLLSSR